MGIFQPGGAGTQIHIYDDNDATGRGVTGPHTWAQINAFAPLDVAILRTAAGAVFSATHIQYLLNVEVMIGNPAIGFANATSLVDTTGADIFSPNGAGAPAQSRLRFTLSNGFSTQTLSMGTKIGTGARMTGKAGGSIHCGTSVFNVRGNVNWYGCFIDCAGSLSFQNGSGNSIEIAGTTMHCSTLVLGTAAAPLAVYNSTINGTTSATFCTSCFMTDAANLVWGCTAPGQFYLSTSINRNFKGITLSGAPTVADLRFTAPSNNNNAFDVTFSDTVGIPRFLTTTVGSEVLDDYRTYDTKVVDEYGNSLSGIPVFLENDVDGPVLSTSTLADGNIVFTDNPTNFQQVIKVRAYGDATGSGTAAGVSRGDRVFTLWVNSYKDAGFFPPVQNRETRMIKFEWPGRDRLGSGYLTDGGSFQKVLDVIRLYPGSPRVNPQWTECEIFP